MEVDANLNNEIEKFPYWGSAASIEFQDKTRHLELFKASLDRIIEMLHQATGEDKDGDREGKKDVETQEKDITKSVKEINRLTDVINTKTLESLELELRISQLKLHDIMEEDGPEGLKEYYTLIEQMTKDTTDQLLELKKKCVVADSDPQTEKQKSRDTVIHKFMMCLYVKTQLNGVADDKIDLKPYEEILVEIVKSLQTTEKELPNFDRLKLGTV